MRNMSLALGALQQAAKQRSFELMVGWKAGSLGFSTFVALKRSILYRPHDFQGSNHYADLILV